MKQATARNRKAHWWQPVADALNGLRVRTLRITCPRCHEKGLIVTRWVKGPASKPLYTLHSNRTTADAVCELDNEQADEIRGRVRPHESDIRELLRCRRSFVLFSGGKDSLATYTYLKSLAQGDTSRLTAIYVDTTAGVQGSMDYVKRVSRYLGTTLIIVRPRVDYFTLASKWGIPSFCFRWCCRELKIKPIQEFLKTIKEPKVVFDGIRAAESAIRRQYIPIWYHPGFECLSVSPIFHWSDEQVDSFINQNGIPKTLLHSLGSSTECWCGAYKTESDFRNLYDLDRELFHKLAELENKSPSGYTFIYKGGRKKPLTELERLILEERDSQHRSS